MPVFAFFATALFFRSWEFALITTASLGCHELGHAAFGLPDLYDRDYSSEGLGRWSLMAGGSWNGPSPGGRTRYAGIHMSPAPL